MSDLMFERAAEDILQEAGAAELALHAEAYGERWIVPGSGSITGRQVAGIAEWILGHHVTICPAGPMMLRFLSLFNRPPRGFMQMVPDYQMPIPYDAAKLSALIGKPSVTGYEAAIDQTLDWISATSVTAPR